jgi:hypothetical protein
MDDIVTRLNTEEMTEAFYKAFPTVVTLEDAMRQALQATDEIERLRIVVKHLDKSLQHLEAEISRLERISHG